MNVNTLVERIDEYADARQRVRNTPDDDQPAMRAALERFGPLEYKLLSTGYHYVRAARFAHLFAQWPIGGPVQISHNGELSESDERLFCDECARVADQFSSNQITSEK